MEGGSMMRSDKKAVRYMGILICSVSLFTWVWGLPAGAQEKFPTRPIEVIVPFAPGGGQDIMTRILADAIEPFLGQKMVVINKPGGSTTVGITAVAGAKPDGYTLGSTLNASLTMVPNVMKVSYTLNDFSYIAQVTKGGMIFCVRSDFPAKNVQEFFEYLRNHPGKLTYTTDGIGGIIHFSGEKIFNAMKVNLRTVPYGGAGESISAFLGGHVDIYGGSIPAVLPHIKEGTVYPLFVTIRERNKQLPEVPGVSDLGHPEAETGVYRGIIGPRGIPADRMAILEKAILQAAQTDEVKRNVEKMGDTLVATSGNQFEELMRLDATVNASTAKQIGLTPK
jgi:tripartite-type tricarboxylate transporter receptor subunit TctC